jgi:hypothetical protein
VSGDKLRCLVDVPDGHDGTDARWAWLSLDEIAMMEWLFHDLQVTIWQPDELPRPYLTDIADRYPDLTREQRAVIAAEGT